jgi:alginate O-acetyltransferase complex protein AlgI
MSLQEPIFIFTLLPVAVCISLMTDNILKELAILTLSLLYAFWFSNATLIYLIILTLLLYGYSRYYKETNRLRNLLHFLLLLILLTALLVIRQPEIVTKIINKLAGIPVLPPSNSNFTVLGISFVTFKALSYLIEIRRNSVKPEKNIIRLANFLTFFPVLTAGPIVRYSEFTDKIPVGFFSYEKQLPGIKRFIAGFAKKVIIADSLAKFVSVIFGHSPYLSSGTAWLGAMLYTLQIYYDFTGYTDMAIGLGRILGYPVPENFQNPYQALSLSEFWRRWHMSLTRWFRDYVYIPLGGNRKGIIRQVINILIVFLLTGLWHGQTLPFIIWGFINGFFVACESWLAKITQLKVPVLVKRLYTLFLITNLWVIFRAGNMESIFAYFSSMYRPAGASDPQVRIFLSANYHWLITLTFLSIFRIIFPTPNQKPEFPQKPAHWLSKTLAYTVILAIFIISLSFSASQTHLPFLYAKF